jgi:hypothetical protein
LRTAGTRALRSAPRACRCSELTYAVRAVLITALPGVFTADNDLQYFLRQPPANEDSPFMRGQPIFDRGARISAVRRREGLRVPALVAATGIPGIIGDENDLSISKLLPLLRIPLSPPVQSQPFRTLSLWPVCATGKSTGK